MGAHDADDADTREVPNVVTVAAVGESARPVADLLATDRRFALTIMTDSFPQLMSHRAFPTQVVVVGQTDDRVRTTAQIDLARTLGARVILVVNDPRSACEDWTADLVVPGAVNKSTLVEAMRTKLWPQLRSRIRDPRPVMPTLTDREREAFALWERYASTEEIAEQMGVTNATASTFVWRARRKLRSAATHRAHERIGNAAELGADAHSPPT